jgi:hypothetical protein
MFIAMPERVALSPAQRVEKKIMSDETTGEQIASETAEAAVKTPVEASVAAVPVQTSDRGGNLVLWLGLASPIVALVGALGSAWGFWDFSKGFLGLAAAFVLAILAIAMGVGIGARNRKKGGNVPKLRRWLGMATGLGMIGWLANFVILGLSVPAIHDVSTDLADPPQFQMLALRADNWDAIPGADDAEMKEMTPQQRWEVIHRKAYADIRTVRINEPAIDVVAKAERLAKSRGWEIALADPAHGRLEATATSTFFRFKDHVVIRVKPTEDGTGSVVDMRSVSRKGVSDLGMNAKRVREFLADLSGTVSTG